MFFPCAALRNRLFFISLSCDERVIQQFGQEARTDYASTLIDMEERKSRPILFGNSFSKNSIEERIIAIMKTKRITKGIIIISTLVILCMVVLFATSAPKEESKTYASINSPVEISSSATAALVKDISKDTIVVDVVEYVTDEDTERKNELIEQLHLTEGNDLSDGNFLGGYLIYNSDETTTEWKLTDETAYKFIDWNGDFTKLDYPAYYETTDNRIFQKYMETYDNSQPGMPFFFEVEDGIVKKITERPMA